MRNSDEPSNLTTPELAKHEVQILDAMNAAVAKAKEGAREGGSAVKDDVVALATAKDAKDAASAPSAAPDATQPVAATPPTAATPVVVPPPLAPELPSDALPPPFEKADRKLEARESKAEPATKESQLHKKNQQINFRVALEQTKARVRRNIAWAFAFTVVTNILVLAIPIYLFQISDRVLTSRSVDTLVMLTLIVVAAIIGQVLIDMVRRVILMRTAVEIETRLGSPILSAASRSALGGSSKDYQILGDLQHIRSFLTSGTLLAILDAPLAPMFIIAVFLVHPDLGTIVVAAIAVLLVIAWMNKKATAAAFAEASGHNARSNMTLDALSRNSQIINALGMIPEAVRMWGRDNAASLGAQVAAQDRNVLFASLSKAFRLFAQVGMLGWGAHLSLNGELTGGMVVASSIISTRALAPVEGTIEGWKGYLQTRAAYQRISYLLLNSPLNIERLRLPSPEGRLDVDRVLYVPPPNKKVILNGISFSLQPGEILGIIGNSGAGKSTIGRMLVGSIIPTAGNIRLDMMDLKNWDPRQLGESIGYLPQDVQLFPASIKANIARMREDASDEDVFEAAMLADIHELIASFAQGYETVIAADGSPLSGGQKQRIGLARAFFGNPRLVVLDEPNSNLDTEGEKALALAMQKAKQKGTTVVAITQRHSLLRCVDRIMVMEKGTISAIGERTKILAMLSGANPAKQASATAKPGSIAA